jgi:hypothetical protein
MAVKDLIKKGHTKDAYNNEQLMHLMRCTDDPIYFIENFVKIQHATKGSVPFIMYDFQKDMVRNFSENRYTIALTGRQMGKTTTSAAFLLWMTMFRPDTKVLLAANKFSAAMEIMDRIRYSYEECPNFIRAGVVEYNKGTIKFDNGSSITARATTPDAGRGLSITLLFLDEFAFVRPNMASEFWTAIGPTLSTGGGCIITSTPRSDEDQFAQIWKGANDNTDEYGNALPGGKGSNGFFPIKVTWDQHPDRDAAWEQEFRQKLGNAKFEQEMNCAFVSDEETLIHPMTLSTLKYKEPEYYYGQTRWYQTPDANRAYLVALDPSLGTGGDYSAIQVYQYPEMIQLAEWKHNMTPAPGQVNILIQTLLTLQGTLLQNPEQEGDPQIFWTVENNSIGETILQIIEETGEHNFPGFMVSEPRRGGTNRRYRKGLNTDNRKKLNACSRLKSLIETGRMEVNSHELVKELKMFVATGASYAAKPGCNDDLVMSTLLIVRMLDTVMQWAQGFDPADLQDAIDPDEALESLPMPVVF